MSHSRMHCNDINCIVLSVNAFGFSAQILRASFSIRSDYKSKTKYNIACNDRRFMGNGLSF